MKDRKTKNEVWYDGYCNLCTSWVRWLIKRDKHSKLSFHPLQHLNNFSDAKNETVILRTETKIYTESNAVLRICTLLGFPYNIFTVFYLVPAFLRNRIYRMVSRNRKRWFGRSSQCWLPEDYDQQP